MNKLQEALDKLCELGRKELTFREICEMEIAVETLQKLVEKATPKKTIFEPHLGIERCFSCGKDVQSYYYKYCPHCGQAIDWSNEG